MPYTPIIGTLGYILSPDRRRVLLVHRQGRPEDMHLGKYNGLGGKMEPGEDVAACIQRELFEEAGIEVDEMRFRGTVNWTGFGPKSEDWLGFIFLIERFRGEPPSSNVEGKLEWVEIDRILELPMWEGDRFFLPLVFDADPRPFHGYMPYKDQKPLDWNYTRV